MKQQSAITAPLIGITTFGQTESGHYQLHNAYVEAIRRAGGVPILLPPGEDQCDRLVASLQGLVFTGGGDIHPECYAGDNHPTIAKTDLVRDRFELALAHCAIQANIAILGICRGMQVLSVASGAQLLPHVPDQFGTDVFHLTHDTDIPLPTRHSVEVVPHSQLAQCLGTLELEVVSWHHQAITTVPPGWQVAAYAPDGLIEAVEHGVHPWAIALQWHPELSALEDPNQQRIFEAFVAAASLVRPRG